jgi:N-acetylglutamate synthase-like GNAT family acetyltransferase
MITSSATLSSLIWRTVVEGEAVAFLPTHIVSLVLLACDYADVFKVAINPSCEQRTHRHTLLDHGTSSATRSNIKKGLINPHVMQVRARR